MAATRNAKGEIIRTARPMCPVCHHGRLHDGVCMDLACPTNYGDMAPGHHVDHSVRYCPVCHDRLEDDMCVSCMCR